MEHKIDSVLDIEKKNSLVLNKMVLERYNLKLNDCVYLINKKNLRKKIVTLVKIDNGVFNEKIKTDEYSLAKLGCKIGDKLIINKVNCGTSLRIRLKYISGSFVDHVSKMVLISHIKELLIKERFILYDGYLLSIKNDKIGKNLNFEIIDIHSIEESVTISSKSVIELVNYKKIENFFYDKKKYDNQRKTVDILMKKSKELNISGKTIINNEIYTKDDMIRNLKKLITWNGVFNTKGDLISSSSELTNSNELGNYISSLIKLTRENSPALNDLANNIKIEGSDYYFSISPDYKNDTIEVVITGKNNDFFFKTFMHNEIDDNS